MPMKCITSKCLASLEYKWSKWIANEFIFPHKGVTSLSNPAETTWTICFLRIPEAFIHGRILHEIFFRLLISNGYILNMGWGRKIITVTLGTDAYYAIKIDTRTDLSMQKYKGLKPEAMLLNVTSWSSHSFVQEHLCKWYRLSSGNKLESRQASEGDGKKCIPLHLHCKLPITFIFF